MSGEPHPDPALSASALRRVFPDPGWRGLLGRGSRGLRHLDLEVPRGRCTALIGPNGSGKTTALRCLAGLEHPDGGRTRIFGLPPSHREARRRIGFVPEISPVPPQQSGRAFLEYLAALSGMKRRERRRRADEILERFELRACARRPAATYSKGMLRRLVIAQSFLHQPEVFFFDEPTAGLDPLGTLVWQDLVVQALERGAAVVMSSHLTRETIETATEIVVLDGGCCRARGSAEQIFRDPAAWEIVVAGLDGPQREQVRRSLRNLGARLLRDQPRSRSLRELFEDLFPR